MFPPGMVPPQQPNPMQPTGGIPVPAVNTGPSPMLMSKMGGMPMGGPQPAAKKKMKKDVPVNSPKGMSPASNIMATGAAAPNPYTMSRPPMSGPQPGVFSQSGMGGGPINPGLGFWNQYNQNRPPMM